MGSFFKYGVYAGILSFLLEYSVGILLLISFLPFFWLNLRFSYKKTGGGCRDPKVLNLRSRGLETAVQTDDFPNKTRVVFSHRKIHY